MHCFIRRCIPGTTRNETTDCSKRAFGKGWISKQNQEWKGTYHGSSKQLAIFSGAARPPNGKIYIHLYMAKSLVDKCAVYDRRLSKEIPMGQLEYFAKHVRISTLASVTMYSRV